MARHHAPQWTLPGPAEPHRHTGIFPLLPLTLLAALALAACGAGSLNGGHGDGAAVGGDGGPVLPPGWDSLPPAAGDGGEPLPPPPPPPPIPPGPEWSMAAANPGRTSWVTEEVRGNLQVEWTRPIEAYIDQKVQLIAALGLIYVSTSRGLIVLRADNGELQWRFDTELPLGHSPTVDTASKTVYVGGFDRKLHALEAQTGKLLWSFAGARGGYNTNPLVVEGKVILGNRDGALYAVSAEGSAQPGQLAWSVQTGGPINLSAAYAGGVVFFGANDNHAYAVQATDGSQLWKSAKLPGDGFHSFWPVVYQDKVIFSPACTLGDTGVTKYIYQVTSPWPPEMEGELVGPVKDPQPWSNGFNVIQATRVLAAWEERPHYRSFLALGRQTGQEWSHDSDGDGKAEYIPFGWWAKRNGATYPPAVDATGALLYAGSAFTCCSDAKGKVYGWSLASPAEVSLVGSKAVTAGTTNLGGQAPSYGGAGWAANAEPQAISGGGSTLYRSLCCDRVGDWSSVTSPAARGQLWSYSLGKQIPGYDALWSLSSKAISRHMGWYSGKRTTTSGQYHSHGDQNPLIPYAGRIYVHRSNVIIAYGTGAPRGELPLLSVQSRSDAVAVPDDAALRARIEEEVQKMIAVGGHLRPGYSTDSMHNYGTAFGDYFRNPGDTLLTLAMAYPHLSAGLQGQVAAYLKDRLLPDYFTSTAYADMGWVDGQPRESMTLPPEVAAELAGKSKRVQDVGFAWPYPPQNLYALYRYAKAVPGADLEQVYGVAKGKVQQLLASGVISPAGESATFSDEPQQHNAWIAGYQGFLLLQDLAGKAGADGALRSQISAEKDRLIALRVGLFDKDSPWEAKNNQYKKTLDLARNFLYLTPELGDALKPGLQAKVQEALAEYDYIAPFWFVGKYEASFGESTLQNLYTPMAIFLARAHVMDAPRGALYKVLDEPSFPRGDLFYLQKLVTALEAPL